MELMTPISSFPRRIKPPILPISQMFTTCGTRITPETKIYFITNFQTSGYGKYQKWMKTRPRLKALDIYATGCDTIKGSPTRICRTIHPIGGANIWISQSDNALPHINCIRSPTHLAMLKKRQGKITNSEM